MTFTFTATRGYNPQNIQSSSARKKNNLKILHHQHPPPWLVITPELASGVLRTTSVQAKFWFHASQPRLDGRALCQQLRVVLHHALFYTIDQILPGLGYAPGTLRLCSGPMVFYIVSGPRFDGRAFGLLLTALICPTPPIYTTT